MNNINKSMIPMIFALAGAGMVVPSSAFSACGIGPDNGEISLQAVMNGLLGSAAPIATADCVPDAADSVWTTAGSAAATLIVEIAGYAGQNTFGIYDLDNTGNFVQIYAGESSPFDRRTLTFTPNGGLYDVGVWSNGGTQLVSSGTFQSDQFGFYLSTPEIQTYYSDTSLNADGVDHLLAYQGNGASFLNTPSVPEFLRGTIFHDQMYLLAWEDLFGGGDRDYQDMVLLTEFMVPDEFMAPVPVPPALLLLASALAGLGVMGRRANAARVPRGPELLPA